MIRTSCAKVLLDNCIFTGAELAESATTEETVVWGNIPVTAKVVGYRKKVFDDPSLQKEVDAIVTIGRLIKSGIVAAFTSNELKCELNRRPTLVRAFYALEGCHISSCPAPIERNKFRQTVNFSEYISKGGKKDRKRNFGISDFNQIPFIEWLLRLDEKGVQSVLKNSEEIGLTEFEMESFMKIDWFKFVCSRFGSPENYPDAFHLWTAERNDIDVFLTLERKLPNIVAQIRQSKNEKHHIRTSVFRPIEFLQSMGISKQDDPPIAAGKFYSFMDGHT